MSDRDPLLYVDDILEAIQHIEEYTKGVRKASFIQNVQLQDSVIRRLTIIGEATKKLPDQWRELHPHLPWRAIAGTRDKLIHAYFGVDADQIWEIVAHELAPLKAAMKNLRGDKK